MLSREPGAAPGLSDGEGAEEAGGRYGAASSAGSDSAATGTSSPRSAPPAPARRSPTPPPQPAPPPPPPACHIAVLASDAETLNEHCVSATIKLLRKGTRVRPSVLDLSDVSEASLRRFDGVLVTGGEPRRIRRKLGGGGASAIRAFVRRGGGYVGVCAGAVLATQGEPSLELLPSVSCYNDNKWWDGGPCGLVPLCRPPPRHAKADATASAGSGSAGDGTGTETGTEAPASSPVVLPPPDAALSAAFVPRDDADASAPLVTARAYAAGPVLVVSTRKGKARRRTPTLAQKRAADAAAGSDGSGASAGAATAGGDVVRTVALFAGDVEGCPAALRGEMEGKAAAVSGPCGGGWVVASSVHPELKGGRHRRALLEAMCLRACQRGFAAGDAGSVGAVHDHSADGAGASGGAASLPA